MQFDYIAHLETMTTDLKIILPKIGAEEFLHAFPEKNIGSTKSSLYRELYSNVSKSTLTSVLSKYKVDADMFGYEFDDYLSDSLHSS